MDAALMQVAFEAPPAAPPKGQAKPAASPGKDDGGFGAMFAGLVDTGQPQGGEGVKADAETTPDGESAPAVSPGMLNFAALLASLQVTAGPQQAAPQPQAAQEQAGAIAPIQTALGQASQAVQTLPTPQTAVPVPPVAPQSVLPEAVSQPAGREGAQTPQQMPAFTGQQSLQQTPAFTGGQTLPAGQDAPTAPAVPSATPATATAPSPEMQTMPVPTATDMPAPVAQPATDAPSQEAAGQQQTSPAAVTQAAIAGEPHKQVESAPAPSPTAAETNAHEASAAQATQAAPVQAAAGGKSPSSGDDGAQTAESFQQTPPSDAPQPQPANASQVFAGLMEQAASRANAANDAAAPQGAQSAPAQDPHDVAGQIVDHARLITRAENSEMVIKLKPEHLGELTLKIVVDSGAVSATFHSSNSEVRAAIEASLPQLRQDMANQGLKVDNVGVYASLDHFFANDQRHAPQQQMPQPARRPSGDDAYAEPLAAATAVSARTTAGGTGIDYRV
ncbi:flagellar hook-length control protein FliK [Anaeroselena agilis]|uniref:Flagellar hook-length control protein FliK n=1 Tax=Anaeroselena agilis TaxID=3063788 RepID=A0ABU3NWW3_9FIRM|nr:flagellar hook-length control protein FliK [Selenomonadales bacterium 4137-cl]